MVYSFLAYFSFLLKSSNQHGVHSPFVYQLFTSCLKDKTVYPEYQLLDAHRKDLYKNNAIIEIVDLGAGSRVFTSNQRAISAIAKNAGIPKKRQQLLFRLSQYLKPNRILELGTSLGMATTALSLGNPKAEITTVEGCPATAQIANNSFKRHQLNNIHLHQTTFEAFFNQKQEPFDLIYVDGAHSLEATLNTFESLLGLVQDQSLIIFDDIYWSKGMQSAWQQIRQHPSITVSIDCYYWGLAFFRSNQEKEHFTLRL